MKKRFLATFLSVLLICSSMPAITFAGETDVKTTAAEAETEEETTAIETETKEETAAVKTETEEEITVIETETEEETAAAETGTEGEADVSTGELTESQESPDTEVPEETEEESIEEAADEAASEEDTATTQELKLTRSLLSSTDSVATTYVSDSYTIYYNNLDGNLVIEEGATLTISDDYLSLNGYTLTNYGTINESSAIFICLSGVFYNYGVYRFGDITGNYDNENIYDLALSSVGLSAGILSPSFSQGIREYAVTVDYDVTSIDITPTLNTGTGVKCMTVNGATATSGTASTVSLRVGENKIPIVITADDENSTTNTYTLTVTRESNEIYIIDIANFVSAGTLGISQDMLQWSDVEAPGGYLLEIYTESGKYVADYPDLTVNYIEACEVLTSSGNFYFTVYALDEDGNELSFKTSDIFTYTHTHTLEYAEAVEATCEEEGNTEYWFCLDCGKYFSDSDATTEISLSDTVVYGHTYDTNGFCTGCGRYQPAELNSGGVYEISNAGQLFWFASLVNGDTAQEGITEAAAGANAVLTVNISLSTTTATHTNTGWTPIGDYSRSTAPYYSGTFDGQNHTVSGLYINSSNDYQGLFGYIGSSGMVQNVTVSGSVSASGYVGGVAGYNGGTVQNVTVSGSVSASGNAGGVAGYNSGIVQNVTVSGSVTASGNYAGGAVGRNDGTVRNVTAGVMVTGTNRVGGVVGFNDGGTVTYCINSGTASCSNMNAGGVAGYNNGTVKNCYSSGTVSGSYVGGVVGWNNSGTVGNCYSSGNVSGSKNVGGVAGLNSSNGGTVMNCYYLEGAADAAIGSDSGLSESVAAKTAKEFASGEVAYLLNGSVSGGTTWYQNIDNSGTADSYPVLNSTHGTVCCGTDCTGTAIYSNRTVPAAAHSYEAVVTEPTCTEKGYTTYTCSICGDSYTADETDVTGHSWDEGAVTAEATCTEDGVMICTCTVCGETKTEAIEAAGHSYEAVITEPTYTEQGYTVYTCTNCGDSYTADYTAIKVIDGMDKNLTTKTIVQGLTVVPEGLNEKYSSADELISDLTGRITLGTEYTVDNAAVYDVVLQYQINDGEWTNATVDNYPETGITVTLPYPEGTDRSYEFTVLHMFTETSSRLNITAGEIEMPTVTKTGGGLVFTLNGLSPVAVAWKEAETEAETEKEPAPAISPSGTWKHGLVLDTDGVFRYYQNNAFAKDYVGVVPYDGGLFFIKKRSD